MAHTSDPERVAKKAETLNFQAYYSYPSQSLQPLPTHHDVAYVSMEIDIAKGMIRRLFDTSIGKGDPSLLGTNLTNTNNEGHQCRKKPPSLIVRKLKPDRVHLRDTWGIPRSRVPDTTAMEFLMPRSSSAEDRMSRSALGRGLRPELKRERHLWAGISVESVSKSKPTYTKQVIHAMPRKKGESRRVERVQGCGV
jgi:hypothetical protein